jgi:hypothetical protein
MNLLRHAYPPNRLTGSAAAPKMRKILDTTAARNWRQAMDEKFQTDIVEKLSVMSYR